MRGLDRPFARQRRPQAINGAVAVEKVHGFEGDEKPFRGRDVHAGFLDGAHVEIMRVHELHDDHAEHVLIGEMGRSETRKAAKQVLEAAGRALGRRRGAEKADGGVSQILLLLVHDGVAR